MPLLDCGTMDQIKTGYEVIPATKKVKVKVTAPTDEQKKNEIYKDADGRFSMVKFWLTILEGPFTNRVVQFSTFTSVTKEAYISWKLKSNGSLLSEAEKTQAWEEGEYKKNLKRFSWRNTAEATLAVYERQLKDTERS